MRNIAMAVLATVNRITASAPDWMLPHGAGSIRDRRDEAGRDLEIARDLAGDRGIRGVRLPRQG